LAGGLAVFFAENLGLREVQGGETVSVGLDGV
jgi:hypothetical protein